MHTGKVFAIIVVLITMLKEGGLLLARLRIVWGAD